MLSKDAKTIRSGPGGRPGRSWWLVAKDGRLPPRTLTVDCGDGRALVVFSDEGEAEMFVWFSGAFEDGWRSRETPTGELVSMLCGPRAGVRGVALDPSPGVARAGMIGSVTVSLERFLDLVVAPGRRRPVSAAE